MGVVFVSYRRDDTGMVAVDVARELRETVDSRVFFDLGSIELGKRFNHEISEALARCSVVVVLFGRNWAGRSAGVSRINEEGDVFRREIEAALSSTAAVIPVLVGDLDAIDVVELPPTLRPLVERNWHRIRLENKWEAIRTLAGVVAALLEQKRFERIYGTGTSREPSMYRTLFNPSKAADGAASDSYLTAAALSEDAVFRINVAMATGRTLIVTGPDPAEYDALPYSVASALGWRTYSYSFSATSTPKDLLYTVDDTRRLADAQSARVNDVTAYIEPGAFWWAFDAESAARRGSRDADVPRAADPSIMRPRHPAPPGAVLLFSGESPRNLDEYLRPLQRKQFFVREAGLTVQGAEPVLAFVSTGDLRAIDPAVRRRAIVCSMSSPTEEHLVAVARRATNMDPDVIRRVIQEALRIQQASDRNEPMTSRVILDALVAVNAMEITIDPDNPDLRMLLDLLIPQ